MLSDEARRHLDRALALASDESVPHLEAAIAATDAAAGRAFLLETYAGLLLGLGREDDAVVALERALELRTGPAADEAAFGLATVLRMIGRTEASDAVLTRFDVDAATRRAKAEALLATDLYGPFEIVCRIELATAHAQLGDSDRAIETLQAALTRIEEEGDGDEPLALVVLLRLGALQLYQRRDTETARELLDEALGMAGEDHPLAAELLLHLGHADLIDERPEDARALLGEAERRTPDEPAIQRAAIVHALGIAQLATRDDAARETFERAAALAPDEALAAAIRTNAARFFDQTC